MGNPHLRFHQHLEAVFTHLGFGTTKTMVFAKPSLSFMFYPNILKTVLNLLILLLHFHLYHQNIHFKHITGRQRNGQLSAGALSPLDLGDVPKHSTDPTVTSTPSDCPSYTIFALSHKH